MFVLFCLGHITSIMMLLTSKEKVFPLPTKERRHAKWKFQALRVLHDTMQTGGASISILSLPKESENAKDYSSMRGLITELLRRNNEPDNMFRLTISFPETCKTK